MNATNPYVAKTRKIDDRCEILAGLRMEITNASTSRYGFHRSPELKARARKLDWAESVQRPDGAVMWAADLDIKDSGDIDIPHDAVEPYFIGKGAHLMLNIFCDMPKDGGYYATLGFFKKPEIYTFDNVVPQDEQGRWTYSRPIHLTELGKNNFFMFMTLRSTGGPNVELTVHKITVARGKEHYHLAQAVHFKSRVFDINQLAARAASHSDLRDLPIAKLVDAYKAWNA